ncbi:GHKL domain protein [Leptospira broomii serovar Hurstbridge str. 5399]|uniref:histidine kinase n=1 Tax=Leptospira broomii serovar Hurstbridge str. 5399 TaxID=1049789 RepID=T0GD78_9LEPT|nr:ATP-binding protein [Leptospira broomii]EQA43373.1 GHKL domain protein [Leptospira broomii serovar Hurstbridge str. 5399]
MKEFVRMKLKSTQRDLQYILRTALFYFIVVQFCIFHIYCTQLSRSENIPKVKNGILDLRSGWDFNTQGLLGLDGIWEFYWQEFYSVAEAASSKRLRSSESHGLKVLYEPVPDAWNNYESGKFPGFGFASYRMRILTDKPVPDISIKMLEAATAYRLFVNGKLLLSNGTVGKTRETAKPLYRPAVSEPFTLEKDNELIVEVSNFSHSKGGLWGRVFIGNHSELSILRQRSIWFDLFMSGGLSVMGLYQLSLFAFLRRDRFNLYFGLVCLFAMIRMVLTGERFAFSAFPEFDFNLSYRLELLSVYLESIFFALFLRSMFPDEVRKPATTTLVVGSLALSVIVLFTELETYSRTLPLFSLLLVSGGLYLLFALSRAVKKDRPGAWIGLTLFIGLFTIIINDLLYANMIINTTYFLSYGISFFFIAQAFMVSQRFSYAYNLSEKLTDELLESNRRLVSLDKLKDEFLANTSHELRTPLQGIIGIADSVKRGAAGPLSRFLDRQMTMIIASGERLSALVNDILDFSKLKHKDLVLNRIPVDLRQSVEFTLGLNRINVDESKLSLVNSVPADFPHLKADENRLQQILQNLIGNAIKFTESGVITISARLIDSQFAEVSVQDTGIGVKKDDQKKIFDFFEQADGGDARNVGGAGLGLAISKALVRLHGGEIGVESEDGNGARFYFTMPVSDQSSERSDSKPNAEQYIKSEISSLELNFTPDSYFLKANDDFSRGSVRILAVDDEPINLEVIGNYLALCKMDCLAVRSGLEALDILANDKSFNVIILDVMMPRFSGLETAKEIRNSYSALELPILMLTAKNQDKDLVNALNAGANDYLLKPFNFEQLIRRVNNLIELARGHKNLMHQENEKRIAINTVRQKINIDLHDHLGGKLIDLKFLSEELLNSEVPDPALIRKINGNVNQSIQMLRDQMLKIEDLGLVSENFFSGINLILLRRYSDAGRDLDFQCDEGLIKNFVIKPNENSLMELYGIVNEIANNDLKYGIGISRWNFESKNREIVMDMRSESLYHLKEHGTGRGTENLIQRSAKLEGRMKMILSDSGYQITLQIPFGKISEY